MAWQPCSLLLGLQAQKKALSSEAFSCTMFLLLWHLPRLYLLTFKNNENVHLLLKGFASNDNEIYLLLRFKMQSQDSGLTRWLVDVDHWWPGGIKNKQNKDTHKTKTKQVQNHKSENFGNTKEEKGHLIVLMFNCQIFYLSIPVQPCLTYQVLEPTEYQSTFAELKVLLVKIKMAILLFLSDGPTD